MSRGSCSQRSNWNFPCEKGEPSKVSYAPGKFKSVFFDFSAFLIASSFDSVNAAK